MPPALIDIGANLSDASFASDRTQVIERALAAGVSRMVLTGTTAAASAAAFELARTRPGTLFSTAGVHPHHASDCDHRAIESFRALAAAPEVVAIGECGLDFYRDLSPRDQQVRALEAHIRLASELGLPLFLHERNAHDAMADLLRPQRHTFSRAVVHCFTGDEDALRAYLELDLHIGITGWICDERRGSHLRDIVRLVPPDRLMIETDAPYLLPRTIRPRPKSRRNEPAYLPHVLDMIANSVGSPREEVAAATTATAEQFFALP